MEGLSAKYGEIRLLVRASRCGLSFTRIGPNHLALWLHQISFTLNGPNHLALWLDQLSFTPNAPNQAMVKKKYGLNTPRAVAAAAVRHLRDGPTLSNLPACHLFSPADNSLSAKAPAPAAAERAAVAGELPAPDTAAQELRTAAAHRGTAGSTTGQLDPPDAPRPTLHQAQQALHQLQGGAGAPGGAEHAGRGPPAQTAEAEAAEAAREWLRSAYPRSAVDRVLEALRAAGCAATPPQYGHGL